MQTRSIVSLIKREASSWSRELIRSLISDVHYIMMAHPMQQNRIIDTSTGKDPIFATTNGTYEYNGNTTDMANFPANTTAFLIDKVYTGSLGESSYTEIDGIPIIGTYGTPGKWRFKENPGTTTTTTGYKARAYKTPTNITSEEIELEVPENWHLTGVYEGVMGWIEKTDNGKSARWNDFILKLCPKFWYECNRSVNQNIKEKYDGGY